MHKLKLNIIAAENPNTAYVPHHHYYNFKTVSKAKERKGTLLMPKIVTSSDTGRISIYRTWKPPARLRYSYSCTQSNKKRHKTLGQTESLV